ncbi:MAG: PAS domain S-box protein [Proteobacteria bacterium]|nr:PAS domain S-box protein [Pseudomonadota bacterium]
MFRVLKNSLFSKVILTAGLMLLASMAVGAFLNISYQRNSNMEHVMEAAAQLTDTIRLGTHYAMLTYATDDIANIIDNTARQSDIESIRIYNKDGEIKYSNHPQEINRTTKIQDEACFVCHQSDPPLVTLGLSRRSRIYQSGGHRVMAVISPIYNEPACSTGDCHVHPENKKVLGLMDVVISLKETDTRMLSFMERTGALAGVIFLATFAALFFFMHNFVNRPIKKLMTQTRRIAAGRALSPSDIDQEDEMGELARAMDRMAREIKDKHDELSQQKSTYQNLFEGVPCIITVQDRNFKLLSYNKYFGSRFAPEPGQHCYEAYKGRSEKCENCPVEKTFTDGRSHVSEETGYHKDGLPAHWIVTTAPIKNAEGEVVAAMEMCLDITPRKRLAEQLERSEEKYLAVFNSIPNPVFVLEKENLTILDCNESVEGVYAMPREKLLGLNFLDFFPEEEREAYRDRLLAEQAIPQARQITAEGLTIYVFIRSQPSEYSGSDVLLVTTSDITQRLETEQQLIQASKMATLGEMATGVAHELNQPLSVIKTAATFFMNKVSRGECIRDDILKTMATEIDAHVDRASKIINHLREFGRKPEVTLGSVDVLHVLRRAFEIFSQQLKLREIEVTWEVEEDLPHISADAQKLEQVFINLLINARDAIEEKVEKIVDPSFTKHITLRTRMQGGLVTVEVEDTGLGIPKAIMDKIFEPFYTTKKVGKGTGLGLSISYAILHDCGGNIQVKSRKNKGARFILTFPPIEESRHDG